MKISFEQLQAFLGEDPYLVSYGDTCCFIGWKEILPGVLEFFWTDKEGVPGSLEVSRLGSILTIDEDGKVLTVVSHGSVMRFWLLRQARWDEELGCSAIQQDAEDSDGFSDPFEEAAMNIERVQWAQATLREFSRQAGMKDEDVETILQDLLCDLRHWALVVGLNYDDVDARAERGYQAEQRAAGQLGETVKNLK